jgi:hypothetical protein
MDLKPGSRWKSAVCETEIVVVRTPKVPVSLECGGHVMVAHNAPKPDGMAISEAWASGTVAGKRFADEVTGLEVLCSKSGAGALSVTGRALKTMGTKKLPSSD